MEKKTITPRCDVAMANSWKNTQGSQFNCKHIGKVNDNDCWHCGCFIARVGLDDEHLRFKDNASNVRQAKISTAQLKLEVIRNGKKNS